MSASDSKNPLVQAAARIGKDPFFLGSCLAEFREIRGLHTDGVAQFLECVPGVLPRLSLCRVPRQKPAAFREDVARIAAFVGANAARLASMLREVSAVRALRASGHASD